MADHDQAPKKEFKRQMMKISGIEAGVNEETFKQFLPAHINIKKENEVFYVFSGA